MNPLSQAVRKFKHDRKHDGLSMKEKGNTWYVVTSLHMDTNSKLESPAWTPVLAGMVLGAVL